MPDATWFFPLGSLDGSAKSAQGHPNSWPIRLAATLRGRGIDRNLVEGTTPDSNALFTARALWLASPPRRRDLALALRKLLVIERRAPRDHRWTSSVPVDQASVMDCEETITMLVEWVESSAPIDIRGVAMLRALLTDGSGPLFNPSKARDLKSALEASARALNPL